MITIRKSATRGHASHGWLDSYHSFSFADYYDPAYMGYSVLRVINDDKVAANQGFGMHGHRDMEIITYMLAGELQHQDSLGNGSVIRAGDVQRMTAGTGIRHSEVNPSTDTTAHLLQIWILPAHNHLQPSYEDKHVPLASKRDQWRLIASPDAREDSLKIHQDVELWASVLQAGQQLDFSAKPDRHLYLQVARGQLTLNGQALSAGDAAMIEQENTLTLHAETESELLLFDLPAIVH